MSHLYRSIETPIRTSTSIDERWNKADKGLIHCWEIGRQLANDYPELAEQCRAGELPVLYWKGGVERTLKKIEKNGSLNYLATWLGLRKEDLSLATDEERTIICSKTKMIVTFTPDLEKLKKA